MKYKEGDVIPENAELVLEEGLHDEEELCDDCCVRTVPDPHHSLEMLKRF